MQQDSLVPFDLPAVGGKTVAAAFDGGRLTSNAGVLLLREVERRLGIAERLAGWLTDRRDAAVRAIWRRRRHRRGPWGLDNWKRQVATASAHMKAGDGTLPASVAREPAANLGDGMNDAQQ